MATGTTPNYSLSYPLSTDPVNVAADVQELAEDLDTFLTAPAFINNLAINAGSLVTSSATAALFNTGATTLNIGGAATTINVGASAGQVNVRGNFNISTGKVYEINDVTVLSATTLGSSVVSSSLTAVGTLTTGTWNAGNILLPLGASSSPSLAFTGDTNTGMWSPTADTVAFSTGGSERIRIDNSGNIGIGITTPSVVLHVATTGIPMFLDRSSTDTGGADFVGRKSRGTIASPTATQANDFIVSLGGRGYGNTAYSSASRALISIIASENWTDTAQGTYITFATTTNGGTTRSERMRIDNAGNVGIGTTSPATRLHSTSSPTGSSVATSGTTDTTMVARLQGGIVGVDSGILSTGTSYFQVRSVNDLSVFYPLVLNPVGGNVGVGTSSPNSALDVNGNIIVRGAGSEGGEIGLLNPDRTTTGLFIDVSSTDSGRIFSTRANSTLQLGQLSNTGGTVTIWTSATERMRIDSAGVINITGSQIVMESGTTGAPTDNVSFKVERGTSPDVEIRWNEVGDAWQFTNDGTTYFDIPTSAGGGTGLQDVLMFAGM